VIQVARFPLPGQTVTGREFQVHPGGKGGNQACAAARLGGTVSMVGQVGNDAQAEWLRANLVAAGVDAGHVVRDATVSSGVATITIDDSGQNHIIIVPGANGSFSPAQLKCSQGLIESAGLVLLQLEIPLDTVLEAARLAKRGGATVILDPAPARELPDELLALTDYLTPNETELAMLAGAPGPSLGPNEAAQWAAQLLKRGARSVIAKLGAQGALLAGSRTEQFWPAIPVQAVDTTAAGDVFNGAVAAALASGKSEYEAGVYATAAAACCVMKAGAQPSLPGPAEVQLLLGRSVAG
jgi:ribokinase